MLDTHTHTSNVFVPFIRNLLLCFSVIIRIVNVSSMQRLSMIAGPSEVWHAFLSASFPPLFAGTSSRSDSAFNYPLIL